MVSFVSDFQYTGKILLREVVYVRDDDGDEFHVMW